MSHYRPKAGALILAFACALALLAMRVAPALALIWGTLVPAAAQPGDWVVLTTDAGDLDPGVYRNIAAAGPLPAFLQHSDLASAGNACAVPIGDMTWSGGIGTLRFQVPEVPQGTYWILVLNEGACERFGTREGGVLELSVIPDGGKAPSLVLVTVVVAIGAALTVGAVIFRLRRREMH